MNRLTRFFHVSRHCVFCGTTSPDDICVGCAAELPYIENCCQQCGIPMSHDSLCGDCLIAPPQFARCLAPLRYEVPISHLVGSFKYRGNFNHGRILSQLLIERLRQESTITVDALIPVPLHWRRRWSRGFNQSEIVADELSRAFGLQVQTRWLRRIRGGTPQQRLDADARQKNLRDAFACSHEIEGRHLAVIDDVVTTGATANAIARILRESGAASVQIWALARTP
ncbi:MAG TPA: ComF family protein [Spongiibacteraceae bacterium]|nr:ComF family protein [Spongiibacteraceae bacterium]